LCVSQAFNQIKLINCQDFAEILSTTHVLLFIGEFALGEEVKVTRKYQVTIPESVRTKLGVKIGDKLIVKSENKQIIMEASKRISHPSDVLWNLFGKPLDIDATKLVEESWQETVPSELKKLRCEKQKVQ
jgi:AbrB family looped-hinge helix DNA binding protein